MRRFPNLVGSTLPAAAATARSEKPSTAEFAAPRVPAAREPLGSGLTDRGRSVIAADLSRARSLLQRLMTYEQSVAIATPQQPAIAARSDGNPRSFHRWFSDALACLAAVMEARLAC